MYEGVVNVYICSYTQVVDSSTVLGELSSFVEYLCYDVVVNVWTCNQL